VTVVTGQCSSNNKFLIQQHSDTTLATPRYSACTRPRKSVMALGGPWDEIVTKVSIMTRGGTPSVWATSPIYISVRNQFAYLLHCIREVLWKLNIVILLQDSDIQLVLAHFFTKSKYVLNAWIKIINIISFNYFYYFKCH
jgi:hypothetical protein